MRHSGHKCTVRPIDNAQGAATIAELLVVLAVSSILFAAVMSGQSFVGRLAQRFFDGAVLETESRLLLVAVGRDLSGTERLTSDTPDQWILESWTGDTVVYSLRDSTLWRNGSRMVAARVGIPEFTLQTEPQVALDENRSSRDAGELVDRQGGSVHLKMILTHKDRRLEFNTLFPLSRRAPGT